MAVSGNSGLGAFGVDESHSIMIDQYPFITGTVKKDGWMERTLSQRTLEHCDKWCRHRTLVEVHLLPQPPSWTRPDDPQMDKIMVSIVGDPATLESSMKLPVDKAQCSSIFRLSHFHDNNTRVQVAYYSSTSLSRLLDADYLPSGYVHVQPLDTENRMVEFWLSYSTRCCLPCTLACHISTIGSFSRSYCPYATKRSSAGGGAASEPINDEKCLLNSCNRCPADTIPLSPHRVWYAINATLSDCRCSSHSFVMSSYYLLNHTAFLLRSSSTFTAAATPAPRHYALLSYAVKHQYALQSIPSLVINHSISLIDAHVIILYITQYTPSSSPTVRSRVHPPQMHSNH
ncbi:hypothetical protein PROFUN_11919 [Planoprotostelium fungivorum]|uniref:Uncharacterized protein n=1 Tax=Planoprotostelium fungivorum TaxID=1890364 RepID=A0A2P6N8T1_9EUKA|nr:hypothetical protein PROFUN_11919 [Planoprotostelium fungivorum]